MKILLAGKHPPAGGVAFGGVASWMQTLENEFAARGHDCEYWGGGLPDHDKRFDVGLLSNLQNTRRAARWCKKVLTVSHGIVEDERPRIEFPVVFTSEDCRDHWGGMGPVIRQPIDLSFWRCAEKKRRNFVFYSYRARHSFGLERIARHLGLDFVWLSKATKEQARNAMQEAAIVAASGRAALEAMACGAPTLICDWRPYNGMPLFCADINKAMAFNYSGRGGVDPRRADMLTFSRETMAFQEPRKHIETHHDAAKIAEEILRLC